jgi:2-oxoisovalerate ferredoxin oxidoreductase beta subunit
MPSLFADYEVKCGKAKSFYPLYERKSELQHQTHYCPGCGHGIVHKMVAKAIDELGIQDRTILISPVGCSVFAFYYFDVGNIQVAHGRAPAVATAVKRGRPESIVIGYQGDGDLSAIGSAEILHAANRGENITVIFVNNAIYGMTGGQMAPTTLLGQKSSTTPQGRDPLNDGYPLHVSELLATLEAPVYIERVALGGNALIAKAGKAIHRAIGNQVKGLGFSMVEVLSPCPTIWKKDPEEAQRWVREVLTKTFPLSVLRDKIATALPRAPHSAPPPLHQIPEILGLVPSAVEGEPRIQPPDPAAPSRCVPENLDVQIKIAGFGGQGVLLLGGILAEAGLDAGVEVSWLPSYGPEMRSGTSNCHVRLRCGPIDSPLVTRPHVLIAMNEPSLRKFLPGVRPGGWVIFNGEALPAQCARGDVHTIARNFTQAANEIGDARAANVVMLGALLASTPFLPERHIAVALRRLVSNPRLLAVDEAALARGAEMAANHAN